MLMVGWWLTCLHLLSPDASLGSGSGSGSGLWLAHTTHADPEAALLRYHHRIMDIFIALRVFEWLRSEEVSHANFQSPSRIHPASPAPCWAYNGSV